MRIKDKKLSSQNKLLASAVTNYCFNLIETLYQFGQVNCLAPNSSFFGNKNPLEVAISNNIRPTIVFLLNQSEGIREGIVITAYYKAFEIFIQPNDRLGSDEKFFHQQMQNPVNGGN